MKEKADITKNRLSGLFILILFMALIYLSYPEIQNYSTTPKWIFLGGFGVLVLFFENKKNLPWSLGLTIWFLFVVNYLIQCNWSYNFWDSFVRAIPLLISPIIVLLLVRLEGRLIEFYQKLALVVSLLMLPLLLYTLVQIAALNASGEYTHGSTYEFRFAFGHRNQFVQFLTLLVPFIFLGVVLARQKWRRYLFFFVIVLIYCVSFLLMNRTVFIVLFGLYPIGVLFFLINGRGKKFRRYAYLTMFAFVVLAGIIVLSPVRKKIPYVGDLTETSYGSGNERIRIWKNSIELWKENRLTGKGSGDWKIEILRTELIHTKAEQSMVFYQRAHNDFIQVAVENGLIGLILLVAFFIVGVIQLYRSNLDPPIKLILLFGVLAFILIANFSFPFEKVELLILLFLFMLPGFSIRKSSVTRLRIENLAIGSGLILTTLLAGIWFKNERLYFDYKAGVDRSLLGKIDKTFYTIDPTSTPLFWHDGNKLFDEGDFAGALPEYEKALKYNPNHVHAINNLGSCFYSAGEVDYAEEQYQKALKINPRFVETLMNYTSLHFNRGDIDAALNTILKVPIEHEPENYKVFIDVIGKAKFKWLIELYDEPEFERFLNQNYNDASLMYQISLNSRNSWASFEDELRIYFMKQQKNK